MPFRGVTFAFALLLLIVGILGTHYILTSIMRGGGGPRLPNFSSALTASTPTATPVPVVTVAPAPTHAARRIAPTPTVVPRRTGRASTHRTRPPRRRPVIPPVSRPAVSLGPPGAAAPLAAPQPTLLALARTGYTAPAGAPVQQGIIRLVNYWVGTPRVRRGRTVSVGYVIDNETGVTVRLMLGASIKGAHDGSWASDAISDPAHDVVATVAPGTTTHVRFFAIWPNLRPGAYDVAWGLQDAQTGRRVALVMAGDALQVVE